MRFVDPWRQALQRRLSRQGASLHLGLDSLYIVPSGFGLLWLLIAGILYLAGINSQSNGPLLLALMMLALLLMNLFLTHHNLQGLELRCLQPLPSCADEVAMLPILALSRRSRAAIRLRCLEPVGKGQPHHLVHLAAGSTTVLLPWRPPARGLHQPGRLLIATTAPLGLFRCWSYWNPPFHLAIAPARCPGPVLELRPANERSGLAAASAANGCDQFEDLTPLRAEEGLQRVAWKTLARGQGWYGKRFSANQEADVRLAPLPSLPRERALEHVCERLCRGLAAGEALGLQLPNGVVIPAATGSQHMQRCLEALAALP